MAAYQIDVIVAKCLITFTILIGDGGQLQGVAYTFRNDTDRPALIFNLLAMHGEHPAAVDPNKVAAWPVGPTLEISKMAYPAPELMSLEHVFLPLASRVDPGETFKEQIVFGGKLRIWHPYFQARDITDDDIKALSKIWFRLGFFLADPSYLDTLEPTELSDRKVYEVPGFDPRRQFIADFNMDVPALKSQVTRD